jgi:hypothetical protein
LCQHLEQIPFIGRLIGGEWPANEQRKFSTTDEAVADAVNRSDIEAIQRLSEKARLQLVKDITELATSANLYGTQLKAFCDALKSSLHCTQGPPGTGKVRSLLPLS